MTPSNAFQCFCFVTCSGDAASLENRDDGGTTGAVGVTCSGDVSPTSKAEDGQQQQQSARAKTARRTRKGSEVSIHSIEKVLWDMMAMPHKREAFANAPDALLQEYALSDDEKEVVKAWDVRTMTDRGVSPMLTMISWMAVRGQDEMPEYMRRMNTPAGA